MFWLKERQTLRWNVQMRFSSSRIIPSDVLGIAANQDGKKYKMAWQNNQCSENIKPQSYTSIQSPAATSRMALAKRSLHDYCARCRAGSAEASLAAYEYNIVTWNTYLGLELYSNSWRLHCISCGVSSSQESTISSKKLARSSGKQIWCFQSPHDSTVMPRFAIYHNPKLQG